MCTAVLSTAVQVPPSQPCVMPTVFSNRCSFTRTRVMRFLSIAFLACHTLIPPSLLAGKTGCSEHAGQEGSAHPGGFRPGSRDPLQPCAGSHVCFPPDPAASSGCERGTGKAVLCPGSEAHSQLRCPVDLVKTPMGREEGLQHLVRTQKALPQPPIRQQQELRTISGPSSKGA